MAPVVLQVGADGPSPRPNVTWHRTQPVLRELLPSAIESARRVRRARDRNGTGPHFRAWRSRGEGLNDVRESDTCWSEIGPCGHRGVRHAAPDDVTWSVVGSAASGGSRADLELADRKFRVLVRRWGRHVLHRPRSRYATAPELHVELFRDSRCASVPDVLPRRAPIPGARRPTRRSDGERAAARESAHQSVGGHQCDTPWREASGR